jgi:hypothetical protein
VVHARTEKEVYITPLTIRFRTLSPPKFGLGYLTPLSIIYRAIDPLHPSRVVLTGGLADVDSSLAQLGRKDGLALSKSSLLLSLPSNWSLPPHSPALSIELLANGSHCLRRRRLCPPLTPPRLASLVTGAAEQPGHRSCSGRCVPPLPSARNRMLLVLEASAGVPSAAPVFLCSGRGQHEG